MKRDCRKIVFDFKPTKKRKTGRTWVEGINKGDGKMRFRPKSVPGQNPVEKGHGARQKP